MRPWIGSTRALAGTVTMVHEWKASPGGARHESHSPAIAKGCRSLRATYMGVLVRPSLRHSKKPSASTRQRRRRSRAPRKAGLLSRVSARALMVLLPMPMSLAE